MTVFYWLQWADLITVLMCLLKFRSGNIITFSEKKKKKKKAT